MAEQLSINPWDTISERWRFDTDNYYNTEPHDEKAAVKAQLAFALKTETKIKELLPENLTELSRGMAKFLGENPVTILKDAAYDGPPQFYRHALAGYRQSRSADSPDLLDFGLFVRDFQRVVDIAMKVFWNLPNPDAFFNIHHDSWEWLLDDIFQVTVDLLATRLNQELHGDLSPG